MMNYDQAVSRCWAEVDLTRLLKNYHSALRHLKEPARLMAVLKANAYGLGAPVIARVLRGEGQRLFAVASYDEAAQLLKAVPDADVLILGLVGPARLKDAMARGMIISVFSRLCADQVIAAAREAGVTARVHVKVETGLNRLGLSPADVPGVVGALTKAGAARVEGVYTHLALRDRASDRDQLQKMYDLRAALTGAGYDGILYHALDSIGMVRYPDDQMDLVRTGAWLYGVCPRGYDRPDESQLCLTVKARVAELHPVSAGSCLGYDETHPLRRDSLIATISAGYVDGFPRLNSEGYVLIRGRRAPVAGLVCMDQMMADVTDIPDAREGDEVTLLGGGIPLNEYADLANLNRNEALALTGRRVPRVYLSDGAVALIAAEMDD